MSQHHADIGKHFNLHISLYKGWNWGKERAAKLLKVAQEVCSRGRTWTRAVRVLSTLPSAQFSLSKLVCVRFPLMMVSAELCELHGDVMADGQIVARSLWDPHFVLLTPFVLNREPVLTPSRALVNKPWILTAAHTDWWLDSTFLLSCQHSALCV